MSCDHTHPSGDNWHVELSFNNLTDDPAQPKRVDHRMLDLKLTCRSCGEPMHFIGPEMGVRFDAPAVSFDGTTISLPFAPGRRPQLGGPFRVRMPATKGKN